LIFLYQLLSIVTMNASVAKPAGFRFDPSSPEYVDDPYPTYKVLRDHHPAYHLPEHGLWLITRQADVLAALTNPAVWSSSRGNVVVDAAVRVGRTLGTLDPPRHDELRAVINKGVTPARVRALLPEAREHARERAAAFARDRGGDVVGEFGRPILNRTLARLVGLDAESAQRGAQLVEAALDTTGAVIGSIGTPETSARIFNFLHEQVIQREDSVTAESNADDFLTVLISARKRGAPLSNEEIAANMMTVLMAGSASVVHFFGNLMRALWLHPDQKKAVGADKALIDAAIEEAVRWDTSTPCFARQVMSDVEVAGVRIPQGSRALVFLASANRDERAFDNPDKFDIYRKRARHLGFGAGPHQCLGSYTAWQLCRVLLEELLPVIGDFEIEAEKAVRTRFIMFRGFQRLPIRF
jgi:cytochrome P450